jgi:hypothetical protein
MDVESKTKAVPSRKPAAILLPIFLLCGADVACAWAAETSSPAQKQEVAAAPDPDVVKELKRSGIRGLRAFDSDGRRFLVNEEDEKGIFQVYVGKKGDSALTCITQTQQPRGPKPERFKMQANWHPSGRWIFLAAERDEYKAPPILGLNRGYVEGMLQCGLWTNMYAVSPDGKQWHRLTDFRSGVPGAPDGFTGPAFTPDGKKAVWSQIVDGNILAYWPFGKCSCS